MCIAEFRMGRNERPTLRALPMHRVRKSLIAGSGTGKVASGR